MAPEINSGFAGRAVPSGIDTSKTARNCAHVIQMVSSAKDFPGQTLEYVAQIVRLTVL